MHVMKKLSHNQLYLLGTTMVGMIGIIVIVVLLVLVHSRQQNIQRTQQTLAGQLEDMQSQQQEQQSTIAALVEKNSLSAQELEAFRSETQEQLQEQQESTQEAVEAVRTSLTDELDGRVSSVVEKWGDNIAMVACGDEGSTAKQRNRGSGTLFLQNKEIIIMTNKHVVMDDAGMVQEECSVTFPQDAENKLQVAQKNIIVSEEDDWAKILIRKPTPYIVARLNQSLAWCSVEPKVGDDVLIMGFPSIGAEDDITVTTGIVSGFDDDYIISSAKIDKGNSGGAALWLQQECYLGIPTKVHKGVVESLARILDIQTIN